MFCTTETYTLWQTSIFSSAAQYWTSISEQFHEELIFCCPCLPHPSHSWSMCISIPCPYISSILQRWTQRPACTAVPARAYHWWRMRMAVDDRYFPNNPHPSQDNQQWKNGWHRHIFELAMLDQQRERGNYSSSDQMDIIMTRNDSNPHVWWTPPIDQPRFVAFIPFPGAAGCEQVRFEGPQPGLELQKPWSFLGS